MFAFFPISGACVIVFACVLNVSTCAIDCLERIVSEMAYYVSSGALNPTNSTRLM